MTELLKSYVEIDARDEVSSAGCIQIETFKKLLKVGSIRDVRVKPVHSEYCIWIEWGCVSHCLGFEKEAVGKFENIDSACQLLRSCGVLCVTVEMNPMI